MNAEDFSALALSVRVADSIVLSHEGNATLLELTYDPLSQELLECGQFQTLSVLETV